MITKNKNWFTLVELIIVITILSILSTIAFVSFSWYVSESNDAKNLVELNQIEKGISLYSISTKVLPKPKNYSTFTAWINNIYSWEIDEELLNIFKIHWSKNIYKYSIFNNWEYFQVWWFLNKNISWKFIPTTYADDNFVIVKWNYIFNPTLPSLLINSWSTNIYKSDNCFLLNWLSTNLNWNCVKKSDLSLSDFDKNLVWYWDMESYYETSYSWVTNVLFLKDLSWNNYDMLMGNWQPVSILNTASGSIFSQDENWIWIKFDRNNFKYWFTTIENDKAFDFNWRKVKPVPWNTIFDSNENQDLDITKWLSAVTLFDYIPNDTWNKRIIWFNINNTSNISTGDSFKVIDTSFYRINWNIIQKHITPYNDWNTWTNYVFWDVWCWNSNWILDSWDGCWSDEFNKFDNVNLSGKNILISNIDFKNKTYCIYLNWKKVSCENISQNTLNRLTNDWYNEMIIWISNSIEVFNWTIYDTKIYNRTLNDDEITQNSKLVWF